MRSAGAIFSHLGEVALPADTPEELAKTLDLFDPKDLREGQVDRGGVGLHAKDAGGLFEKIPIKHKICTPHVYIVQQASGILPRTADQTLPGNA